MDMLDKLKNAEEEHRKTLDGMLSSIKRIEYAVRRESSFIYHSTPLTAYKARDAQKSDPTNWQLDLRDIIIAGAISGRNVLLNGGTGAAKTHLSMLALGSLFGSKNYGTLVIDTSLDGDKLYNIDFSALQGKTLEEMYKTSKLITSPGILLDEANRAPAPVLSPLQAYLNNQAVVPRGGVEFPTGIELLNGSRYQFKIGTCNEGKQYADGTFQMDPAFRRRFAIEIPVNLFSPTEVDNEKRNLEFRASGLHVPETEGVLNDVTNVYQNLGMIRLDGPAAEFMNYLGRMNNCIKSPFKTKDEAGFTPERCEGCSARALAGQQNYCGNVFAPPLATTNDLGAVARAFALIRAYKMGNNLENVKVSAYDLIEAFPYIAATKIRMDPAWLAANFKSGEPFEAAQHLTTNITQRIQEKLSKMEKLFGKTPEQLTADDRKQIEAYGKDDPWAYGLRDFDYKK